MSPVAPKGGGMGPRIKKQSPKREAMSREIFQIHGFPFKKEMHLRYFLSDQMGDRTRKCGWILLEQSILKNFLKSFSDFIVRRDIIKFSSVT